MKAALAKFLFNIKDPRLLISEEFTAHPLHFMPGESGLGDIDCAAGKVRTDNVTLGIGGIVIGAHEALLVFHCANGRTYHERLAEHRIVGAREVAQKFRGPGTAVTAIVGERRIDGERSRFGHPDQGPTRNSILQVGIVFDPFESLILGALILPD